MRATTGASRGGRPRLYEDTKLLRTTVTLPPEYLAWARAEGGGNVSAGLRRLLEELDQRQGAESASSPTSPDAGGGTKP